jgi:hypothetical protein
MEFGEHRAGAAIMVRELLLALAALGVSAY